MTGIITREERDELRRLYEAALPGTWVADGDGVISRDSNGNVAVVADCHDIVPAVDDTNAALIAAARNALPRLLDNIDALEARNKRMLRLLAGFAYRDWSEYAYAASWYDTNRKPDSWFDSLQARFELLLRGEHHWGGFWDGEIYDERIVDAMRRALEATEVEELQEATK